MYYPINDHELDSIATHNTEQNVFNSVGAFLLAVVISIGITVIVEDEERAITLLLSGAAALFLLLALVCFGWAWYVRRATSTEVKRIKEQSRPA